MTTSQQTSTPTEKPFVMLVALDTSEYATKVLQTAVKLGKNMKKVQIHVIHVLEQIPVISPVLAPTGVMPDGEKLMAQVRNFLEQKMDEVTVEDDVPMMGHIRVGIPWRETVQLASDLGADLLMIGTHDYSTFERILLGSVAELLVRKSPCPVYVVREKSAKPNKKIEIEPPCPKCVEAREQSNGRELWCQQHSQHHARAHVYHSSPDSFAMGSLTFRENDNN
jgi:nucleotide-binding universal stress UspA family protein